MLEWIFFYLFIRPFRGDDDKWDTIITAENAFIVKWGVCVEIGVNRISWSTCFRIIIIPLAHSNANIILLESYFWSIIDCICRSAWCNFKY